MKTNEVTQNVLENVTDVTATSLESSYNVKAYYEMESQSVQETSDLEQLQTQLKQLRTLQQRSQFLIREIAYLLKAD